MKQSVFMVLLALIISVTYAIDSTEIINDFVNEWFPDIAESKVDNQGSVIVISADFRPNGEVQWDQKYKTVTIAKDVSLYFSRNWAICAQKEDTTIHRSNVHKHMDIAYKYFTEAAKKTLATIYLYEIERNNTVVLFDKHPEVEGIFFEGYTIIEDTDEYGNPYDSKLFLFIVGLSRDKAKKINWDYWEEKEDEWDSGTNWGHQMVLDYWLKIFDEKWFIEE